METNLRAILKAHFCSTISMIDDLIESCPKDVWTSSENLVWKHVFHAICGIEFWFRTGDMKFAEPLIRNDVTPDFDKHTSDYATKKEMKEYLNRNISFAQDFFASLTEDSLSEPADVYKKITKLDVILMQIRHIQHHVGYCNSVIKNNGGTPAQWKEANM